MSIFSSIPIKRPKSSVFDLSHDSKITFDMSYLIPVLNKEVLPGDTWSINSEVFIRMMPLVAPIMQQVDVYVHHFYVPLRLLFANYEKFFNPETTSEYPLPKLLGSGVLQRVSDHHEHLGHYFHNGSLLDFLGCPTISLDSPVDNTITHIQSLLDIQNNVGLSPFYVLAYNKIYNDYYRDQNLDVDLFEKHHLEDGQSSASTLINSYDQIVDLLGLKKRCWSKDYFTSALPEPQAGPDVRLPLNGSAEIKLSDNTNNHGQWLDDVLAPATGNLQSRNGVTGTATDDPSVLHQLNYNPNGTLFADLSEATSATINELRRAMSAQKFLEATARAGKRYKEIVLGHFGVNIPDARLQRPEYLGGGRYPFSISEVLSHVGAESGGNSTFVLGDMAGHGISAGQTGRYKKYFTEHGIIMSIMSVMPKASYYQGIDKSWTRSDLYDFAWPEFANLGEQEIFARELNVSGINTTNYNTVFGYTPRYAEYKYSNSGIHGEFRDTLDYWHLARKFSGQVNLNGQFLRPTDAELNRIFAVTSGRKDHLLAQLFHHIRVRRLLPRYGVPML